MNQHCDCEYVISDARDYLSLVLSHGFVSEELNLDLGYELLDKLNMRLGDDLYSDIRE